MARQQAELPALGRHWSEGWLLRRMVKLYRFINISCHFPRRDKWMQGQQHAVTAGKMQWDYLVINYTPTRSKPLMQLCHSCISNYSLEKTTIAFCSSVVNCWTQGFSGWASPFVACPVHPLLWEGLVLAFGRGMSHELFPHPMLVELVLVVPLLAECESIGCSHLVKWKQDYRDHAWRISSR